MLPLRLFNRLVSTPNPIDPDDRVFSLVEIKSKATEVIDLVRYTRISMMDPYTDREPKGLLAVHVPPGRDAEFVSFVVFMLYSADEISRREPSLWEVVFRGEGVTGTLRELRHTNWGDDGYLHYPDAAVITDAFKQLRRWFDF